MCPCSACATARCAAIVDFPSPGDALVTSTDRSRRSKSVSNSEFRSVRIASSYPVSVCSPGPTATSARPFPWPAATGPSRPRQFFTTGSVPITSDRSTRVTCSGSRTVSSSTSLTTAAPTASSVENNNASTTFSFTFGNTGFPAGRAASAIRIALF